MHTTDRVTHSINYRTHTKISKTVKNCVTILFFSVTLFFLICHAFYFVVKLKYRKYQRISANFNKIKITVILQVTMTCGTKIIIKTKLYGHYPFSATQYTQHRQSDISFRIEMRRFRASTYLVVVTNLLPLVASRGRWHLRVPETRHLVHAAAIVTSYVYLGCSQAAIKTSSTLFWKIITLRKHHRYNFNYCFLNNCKVTLFYLLILYALLCLS